MVFWRLMDNINSINNILVSPLKDQQSSKFVNTSINDICSERIISDKTE